MSRSLAILACILIFTTCVANYQLSELFRLREENLNNEKYLRECLGLISTEIKVNRAMLQIIASNTRLVELYKEPTIGTATAIAK
jgi:hypothetical protein